MTKVHCLALVQSLADRSVHRQSSCGKAGSRTGSEMFDFVEGGQIVELKIFRCLPKEAQCGNCARIATAFNIDGVPNGQRHAPSHWILAVETMLHQLSSMWLR